MPEYKDAGLSHNLSGLLLKEHQVICKSIFILFSKY